jgi:PKD repeat protein
MKLLSPPDEGGVVMRSKSAYWQAGSLALACVLTFARPSPAQQASCEAAFTGDPISGCASLLVTFSTQTKDAMAYSWQFPGGYPSTATGQGPHTVDYSAPGVYSVQLIVTCRDQSADTLMRRNYITVSDCPTAIGETVWQDDNGNGIQDAGESGLPNVPTALYKSNGTLVATTLTDVNGGYLFSGLDYGNYYVQFTLLSGYVFSAKDQGSDDSKDSDADPSTGNTDVFFLASDVTDRTRDAGMIPDIQRMEIDTWMDVCYTLDLSIPGVGKSTVSLIGTAVQHVSVGPAGQASDTDGDGRDQVQTELATLNLSGMDPLFGSVVLRLNPSRASYGEIEEHANVTPGILDLPPFTATGMADSYFEALFEIQLTDMGLCLRNEPPVHFHAVIGHKPSLNFNVHTAIMLYPEPLYRVTCGIGAWTLPSPPPDPKAYLAGMAACDPQTQTGETDTWLDVCYAVQLNVPGLGVSTVNLSGTAVQHVSVGPAGEASDTDSDGRDQAQTALTTLNLTGMDPLFGSVSLRLDPSRVSFGEIEEHANVTPGILDLPPFRASGAATSFFDVFLEI